MMKMHKSVLPLLLSLLVIYPVHQATAGTKLAYKFKPQQKWTKTDLYETHSEAMGFKTVTRNTTVIQYRVEAAKKKHWVKLQAIVTSNTTQMDQQPAQEHNALKNVTYTADVHKTGDTRNIKVSGADDNAARMSADAHKISVFWFPELPEDALEPGDEFDWNQTMTIKDASGMSMTTSSKWTFSLEEVDKGLAYFVIKSRSQTKTQSAMGAASMPAVNKGEGIFDINQGMWIEWRMKGKMDMSSIPGMGEMKAFMVNKMTMKLR